MTPLPKHNLLSQPTSFIGRDAEIHELVKLISGPECRLISLVGAGGIGKTRLAIETAWKLKEEYPHGTFFVPLTPLDSSSDIVPTIISVLGVHIGNEGTPREELLKFLSKRQLLLILDNFEHLIDGADLISDVIHNANGVKILVTSREILHLREEWVWQVEGLAFPENTQSTHKLHKEEYSAIKLFSDRAMQLDRYFSSTDEQTSIIQICQLVDGIPLALELAASWLKSLTCQEIVTEIRQSIDFLESKYRNISPRHRSMRAVFDHSWQLCSFEERDVFMRLCVFHGGFARQAAEQVAGATLHTLSALVEKSMLRKLSSGRYDIQELLRQYAAEQLNRTGKTEETLNKHMAYYAYFMQERTPDIKGRRQLEALDEVEADFDNVRVAWNRAVEQANYDHLDAMMESLALFCDMRARYQAGEILFRNAVEHLFVFNTESVHPTYNRLRIFNIFVFFFKGIVADDKLHAQLKESHAFAKKQGDKISVGLCLFLEGEFRRFIDFYSGSRSSVPYYEAALIYHQKNDHELYYEGRILRALVECLHCSGHFGEDATIALSKQHCALTKGIGDFNGMGHALFYHIGYETLEEKDRCYRNLMDIMRKSGDWKSLGIVQYDYAEMVMFRGEFEFAYQMIEEAQSMLEDCGWANIRFTDIIRGLNATFRGDDLALVLDSITREYLESFHLFDNRFEVTVMKKLLGYVILGPIVDGPATHLLAKAVENCLEYDVPFVSAGCIAVLGTIIAKQGEPIKAAELIGLAYTHSESSLMGWMHQWQALLDTQIALEAELGLNVYLAAWERGEKRALRTTLNELLIYFGGEEQNNTLSANSNLIDALTERELEVLRLVAQGDSNRDIAESLTVVIGTVKTHIHNICQKLDANNRTQAVAIARELNYL